MIKQVLTLSKVQLKSLFGINEIRHTKDKKKKHEIHASFLHFASVVFRVPVNKDVLFVTVLRFCAHARHQDISDHH